MLSSIKSSGVNNNVSMMNTDNIHTDIILFLEDKKRGSEKTAKFYKRHIDEFLSFVNLGNNYIVIDDLMSIKHKDVLHYVKYLEDKSNKSSTIDSKLAAMKSLWKFLSKDYGCVLNPSIFDVTLQKQKSVSHPEFTTEEFDLFLEFCKTQQCKAIEKYLYFKMLYITGLRKQAVLNMKWSNISKVEDITGEQIWVVQVRDKGGKYEEVPISNEFYEELIGIKGKSSIIFNINEKTLYKTIDQFKKHYAIEKKLTIHSIKATSLTEAWRRTKDVKLVQEQGHHSTSSITMEKYVRNGHSLKKKMSYKMDRKINIDSLENLSKEELLSIIEKSTDSIKRELLNIAT